jgi:hypothetical protein
VRINTLARWEDFLNRNEADDYAGKAMKSEERYEAKYNPGGESSIASVETMSLYDRLNPVKSHAPLLWGLNAPLSKYHHS